jgi:hypothetical protein
MRSPRVHSLLETGSIQLQLREQPRLLTNCTFEVSNSLAPDSIALHNVQYIAGTVSNLGFVSESFYADTHVWDLDFKPILFKSKLPVARHPTFGSVPRV